MKIEEVDRLPHGVYRLFWKESQGGGTSLASVGSTYTGRRWMAPVNWTFDEQKRDRVATSGARVWAKVEKVVLIISS